MKASNLTVKITGLLAGGVVAVVILLPFHAFVTVWLSSLVGHYTALRLWKECLLIVLLVGSVYLLVKRPALWRELKKNKLHWLIAAYLWVQVVWGLVAWLTHNVTAKALGYAWISNTRFLLFFWVAWVVFASAPTLAKRWPRWVVWPLAVVTLVGLLQYLVLPYDVLKHVGYSESTIYPYETINHNINRLRIMSTLRGANPLGAYLLVVLSLLSVLWFKQKRLWQVALFASGLAALFLSFSRSAWIGFALSLGVIGWAMLRTKRAKQVTLAGAAVLVLIGGITGVTLRHNTTFQDVLFHTNDRSTIKTSSNEGHASALKGGVSDLLHQPLGAGPGTAGPASVYNNSKTRIAENYFVQVGQETGWIGLALFVAINVVLARLLWLRREQPLALSLFAALIGITFVNLLSHAWADDTLAYLWWGLAGVCLAQPKKVRD